MEIPCGAYRGHVDPLEPAVSLWERNTPIQYDAERDVYIDTVGCEARQLPQELPFLKYFYHPFEMTFNAFPFANFCERYMSLAFLICGAYLAFLYFGGKYMATREPIKLKTALRVWNLGLSLFSLIGFLRTAPHLLYYLYERGFYYAVCAPGEPKYGHGAAGLWTMLFVFSKIPELGDTVFTVLEGKQPIFLHWYHHVTVLLYCWHSYATRSSAGLFFISMNYGVHALMYFYYFLAASGYRKLWWAPIVTGLQISQMFVGMFVCAAVYYFERQNLFCDVRPDNYMSGLVMYASYAALFIVFALEKYITGGSSLQPKRAPSAKTLPAADAAAAAVSKKTDAPVADAPVKQADDSSKQGQQQVAVPEPAAEDEPAEPVMPSPSQQVRQRGTQGRGSRRTE